MTDIDHFTLLCTHLGGQEPKPMTKESSATAWRFTKLLILLRLGVRVP